MRISDNYDSILLDPGQMALADRAAIASGIPGIELMENAGRAVAEAAIDMVPTGARVLVACGSGNNGGDGFIAARLLAERGVAVTVALAGEENALAGDAAQAWRRWGGGAIALGQADPSEFALIVDALLGAGLDRDVTGKLAAFIGRARASGPPVLSVDLPSGVDGATGRVRGVAMKARRTVTFFRLKPAHLLFPGRELCGETRLADIGIPASVLEAIAPANFRNQPELWMGRFPVPSPTGHKYGRGHTLVVSGGASRTGAARLAARAALRIGSGLVTLASPPAALMVNAAQLTAIMLARMEGSKALEELLADGRLNALVLGPGLGTGEETRELVRCALAAGRSTVLDADALTSFAGDVPGLAGLIGQCAGPVILTPHGGEFARLFPGIDQGIGKLSATREAARVSGAIVVFKGPDTVIAAPDGRAAINDNAPPWLATAGSGDVLAGMAGGLLAQGMTGFEAASAAVWLHGAAASEFGPGLIAEDLETRLPMVFSRLLGHTSGNML